jgi:hypothetical protein
MVCRMFKGGQDAVVGNCSCFSRSATGLVIGEKRRLSAPERLEYILRDAFPMSKKKVEMLKLLENSVSFSDALRDSQSYALSC